LKAFPDEARRDAGFNLDFVQRGLEPANWKPMKTVGPGVKENRVRGRDRGLSRNLFGHTSGSGLCTALLSKENSEDS
jgi:phage-related protein